MDPLLVERQRQREEQLLGWDQREKRLEEPRDEGPRRARRAADDCCVEDAGLGRHALVERGDHDGPVLELAAEGADDVLPLHVEALRRPQVHVR
eukprot:182307-Lingulodinium_polyedra.AAC.1